LLQAYPDSAAVPRRSQYPLHIALGSYAPPTVLIMLIRAHPAAAKELFQRVPRVSSGELPLLFLLQVPSELEKEWAANKNNGLPRKGWAPVPAPSEFQAPELVFEFAQASQEAARAPQVLLQIAQNFAARKATKCDLSGLGCLVQAGVAPLLHFDSVMRLAITVRSVDKVRRVLRAWYHGALLWARFLERNLASVTLRPSATIIRMFLHGECQTDRKKIPLIAETQRALPPTIQHVAHSEPAAASDETDAVIADLIWAQHVERRLLAGDREPSAAEIAKEVDVADNHAEDDLGVDTS